MKREIGRFVIGLVFFLFLMSLDARKLLEAVLSFIVLFLRGLRIVSNSAVESE